MGQFPNNHGTASRGQSPGGDPVRRTGAPFSIRILVLEDMATEAELMLHALRKAGWKPEWHRVQTKQAFITQLDLLPDVILADYAVPGFGAPQALELLRE